jgi:hypothetical protein
MTTRRTRVGVGVLTSWAGLIWGREAEARVTLVIFGICLDKKAWQRKQDQGGEYELYDLGVRYHEHASVGVFI